MTTWTERRAVRGDGVSNLSTWPAPAPEMLTSTAVPIVLSASYQAALRRVTQCPPGCGCRGTNRLTHHE